MLIRAPTSALVLVLAALCSRPAPAIAAVTLSEDLTAVIMLLGLPCGQVTSAQQRAENDYLAVCADGNRYQVFVSAEGRVVAQTQNK